MPRIPGFRLDSVFPRTVNAGVGSSKPTGRSKYEQAYEQAYEEAFEEARTDHRSRGRRRKLLRVSASGARAQQGEWPPQEGGRRSYRGRADRILVDQASRCPGKYLGRSFEGWPAASLCGVLPELDQVEGLTGWSVGHMDKDVLH